MFVVHESNMYQVPGGGGYLTYHVTVGAGWQIVSIGWRNDDSATDLYASQCYVDADFTEARVQLINTSFTPTDTWYTSVFYTDDAALAAKKPKVTEKVTKRAGKKK